MWYNGVARKNLNQKFRFLISSLPFWYLLALNSFGQAFSSDYSITHYNTDNGLPQNSVNAIQFDKAGYCWLATEMGLVRFDGKSFKEFSSRNSFQTTPFRIQRLAPHQNADLYASIPYSGQPLRISAEVETRQKAPVPTFLKNFTICTPLVGYAMQNSSITKMDRVFFRRHKTPHLSTVLITETGDCYMTIKEQLYFIKNESVHLVSNKLDWSRLSTLVGEYMVHFQPKNKVKVWKNGVLKLNTNTLNGVISKDPDYLNGNFKVFWCVQGTYVYAGKSLYRIYCQNDILRSEKVLGELRIRNMKSIYFSNEQGKYYIGSATDGLYVIEPSSFKYAPVPKEAPSQVFYPQSITPDGRIFSNDILFESKTRSKYIPIKSKDGMATYINPENQLFYESDYLLSRYDLNLGRSFPMLKLDNRLRAIIPNQKNLTFFTRESAGTINTDSAIFQRRFEKEMKIIAATQLNQHHFLLSTESGLKWYNFKKNKIYRSVLDSLQIRLAVSDSAGRIWIASYGMGFYLYENGKIVRMPFGPKQALKTVHAFIDDGKGSFWLPTNNGLFKVQKEDLLDFAHQKTDNVYYYMFDKKNGLRTNEFNGGCDPSYVRLKDGMLSLSSIDGLVWFYPDKIKMLYPQNNIYIDDVVVNSHQARLSNNTISLDPDFEDLSVTVSSPYFGNAVNEYIQYRIEGLNSWQPLPANGKIVVGRSPAGSYKIIVRNIPSLKAKQPKIIELPFEVEPWFYNTWWFYTILAILLIGASYLGVRTRIKNLKERSRQLEQIVNTRTQELKASVEELTQSQAALLKSTRVKDSVISIVLHDLRSPISFLNAISSYLAKSHTSLDSYSLSQKLTELESGTIALNNFTQKFFDWAKSQHEDFKVKKTTFPVQELLDEITELYKEILKSSNNQLTITPTNLTCYTDYQILALVTRNLIDNANKNTNNGRITLSVQPSGNDITISVSDTGTGLTESQIKLFLDKNKGLSHEGIGSTLVLSMLDKIDARLDISSSGENGSTFSVILPGRSQFDND